MQDFIGEKAAFAGKIAAEFDLPAHIAEDFSDRIAVLVHLTQRIEPGVQQARQQGLMHRLFGGEIIEKVGFGQACDFGDLIQRRAAKAIGGKDIERGFEDGFGILLLNPRAGSCHGTGLCSCDQLPLR